MSLQKIEASNRKWQVGKIKQKFLRTPNKIDRSRWQKDGRDCSLDSIQQVVQLGILTKDWSDLEIDKTCPNRNDLQKNHWPYFEIKKSFQFSELHLTVRQFVEKA